MKKLASWLLALLMLLGASAWAEETAATIDELPYLVQSRPDMTPCSLTVTVGEKTVEYAPESGKKDYSEVMLYPIGGGFATELKWTKKTKSYTLKLSEADVTPDMLDGYLLLCTQSLKKDKKIDKANTARALDWYFGAGSGEFRRAVYRVELKDAKDKNKTNIHQLMLFADGAWEHEANGTVTSYDAAGKLIVPEPFALPASLAELGELPDLTSAPALAMRMPTNDGSVTAFHAAAEGEWNSAYFSCTDEEGFFGTVRKALPYDSAAQEFVGWNNQIFQILGSAPVKEAYLELSRRLDDVGSVLYARYSFTNDELVRAAFSSQDGVLTPDSTLMGYTHRNAHGIVDYVLECTEKVCYARFFDPSGNLLGNMDYPM